MELGLKSKVVLVTGGSKGIGLACAQAFAAEGARIAICSRSRNNIDKATAQIKASVWRRRRSRGRRRGGASDRNG